MDPKEYKFSAGFISGIKNGKDGFDKMMPVLEVVSAYISGNPWSLSDGNQTIECVLNCDSTNARSLPVGSRIRLRKFHASTKNRKKILIVEHFSTFDEEYLPVDAFIPNLLRVPVDHSDSSTQTVGIKFPQLLEQIDVPTSLCSQSKFIIRRVCEYLRRLFADQLFSGGPGLPPVPSTAATIFGMSYHTIVRLNTLDNQTEHIPQCSSKKNVKSKKYAQRLALANCDVFVQDKIRRTIHEFYKEKKPVKLDKLIARVSTELAASEIAFHPSKTTFWRILKAMGYRYGKIKRNPVIYEQSHLTEWRHRFLNTISDFRAKNALLFYTDETWVFAGMSHSYDWLDPQIEENPFMARKRFRTTGPTPGHGRGKRAIVIGAISKEGIVPESFEILISGKSTEDGDYHREMNADIFEKWLRKNIPCFVEIAGDRPVVLVMDNAAYHGRVLNRVPRAKRSKRQELIDFLDEKCVPYPANGTKAILDSAIEKYLKENPSLNDEKQAEVICRELGIHLLRLPPYHCIFSPIEELWGHIKRNVRDAARPDDKLERIRELTFQAMENVKPETIVHFFAHVQHVEDDFRKKEGVQSITIDPIIISLEDEDDDEFSETGSSTCGDDEDIDVVGLSEDEQFE